MQSTSNYRFDNRNVANIQNLVQDQLLRYAKQQYKQKELSDVPIIDQSIDQIEHPMIDVTKVTKWRPQTRIHYEHRLGDAPIQLETKRFYRVVTFCFGNDLCTGKTKDFSTGKHDYPEVKNAFVFEPVVAKLNPRTTLRLYSEEKFSGEGRVYNNSYDDRFVVIRLPPFKIKSFTIDPYRDNEEHYENVKNESKSLMQIGAFDMLLIIGVIILLWIYKH